jgi:hypothetical protein
MNEIKIFECGICKTWLGTRKGLREHLKKEHSIVKNLTNLEHEPASKLNKQNWWITK